MPHLAILTRRKEEECLKLERRVTEQRGNWGTLAVVSIWPHLPPHLRHRAPRRQSSQLSLLSSRAICYFLPPACFKGPGSRLPQRWPPLIVRVLLKGAICKIRQLQSKVNERYQRDSKERPRWREVGDICVKRRSKSSICEAGFKNMWWQKKVVWAFAVQPSHLHPCPSQTCSHSGLNPVPHLVDSPCDTRVALLNICTNQRSFVIVIATFLVVTVFFFCLRGKQYVEKDGHVEFNGTALF